MIDTKTTKRKFNMLLTGVFVAGLLFGTSPARSSEIIYSDEPIPNQTQAARQNSYPSNWDLAIREQVVRKAISLVGIPYRRGGDGQYGFDCSGFVHRVLSTEGFRSPRNSRDFYRLGVKISLDQARYGDLLFFHGRGRINHVGIYLGNDRFIHSASSGGVTMSNLNDPYYRRHYAGVTSLFSYPMTSVF